MVEYTNKTYFSERDQLKVNYKEVYSCLKNQMNFGWRMASQRPPRCFQNSLEDARKVFKEFINKWKEVGFVIVWIDESSFNSAALPLYSWMQKSWDAERVIRPTCKRYNVIAAQWNKECYFMIKSDSSNEASFWEFIENVNKELKFRLDKNTYDKRTIVVYDNAEIHKTKKVKLLVKKLKWVVFTIPPYSPELNQIEHTFGILKLRISKKNLNGKMFKAIIKEEIENLRW